MICSKRQLVRLILVANRTRDILNESPAKVISVIEMDGEPGFRRVHLDRALAGSRWHLESDLEAAE